MLLVFIRTIILYIAVLVGLRVMGKGEVAEMNSFDLVITLLIADVASIPIENNNIPMINGFSALIGLVFMQTLISFLCMKNSKIHEIFSGKSSVIIDDGKLNCKNLEKNRITIDELLEQLRVEGYFNLKDIQFAILETDGSLSVVPYPTYKKIPNNEFKHLPISLILDGKVMASGLDMIKKDERWLNKVIHSHNFNEFNEVLVCVLDEYDNIFIQGKCKGEL